MNQTDREILRQRVAGYLASRQQLDFEVSAIRRSITGRGFIDFEVTDEDVRQALVFCEGCGWCKQRPSEVGATVYWSATSAGVLESERKGWNV